MRTTHQHFTLRAAPSSLSQKEETSRVVSGMRGSNGPLAVGGVAGDADGREGRGAACGPFDTTAAATPSVEVAAPATAPVVSGVLSAASTAALAFCFSATPGAGCAGEGCHSSGDSISTGQGSTCRGAAGSTGHSSWAGRRVAAQSARALG